MRNKIVILMCSLICGTTLLSQTSSINSENYYDFYKIKNKDIKGKYLATAWLIDIEAIPIIIEELKEAGYEYPFANSLVKIDAQNKIVVSAYLREPKFGILYIQGHNSEIKKANREQNFYLEASGFEYLQWEENLLDESKVSKIKKLPKNILHYLKTPIGINFQIIQKIIKT